MFNLLTQDLKAKIKSEYKLRLLTVIFIFIIFLQVSFLIFLLPSWIVSVYREKESISQTEALKNSTSYKDADNLLSIIKSTNAKLGILNTTLEYPKLLKYMKVVLSKKSANIHLNMFTYVSTGATTATLSLGGISDTRESLVAFQKVLESTGDFKTVVLPVSNLAKDKNINFSINLTIAP